MATKKKDNPAALAVMGVVLVGALFSVGKSLFAGDDGHAARVAPASGEAPAEAAAARVAGGPLPASERDPFTSTLLHRAMMVQSAASAPVTAQNAGMSSVAPIRRSALPVPGPGLAPVVPYVRIQAIPLPGKNPAAMSPGRPSSSNEMSLARSIRVTAIVMGARPYAVLEPVGSPPRTLHALEMVRSLRLVAIRPGEIVLKGQTGFWTLPLATPESDGGVDDGRADGVMR